LNITTNGGDVVFGNASGNVIANVSTFKTSQNIYFGTGGLTLRPISTGNGSLGSSDYHWGSLDVNNGVVYNTLTVKGTVSVDKTVTITENCKAKTFIQSSDAELKTIKGNIDVDLDRLKEIPKIFFKYNEEDDNITRIGTIAQDVHKIYPEIVHTDDDGHLSLEYDKLSIISLKAIDKLYDRQIELENEIKELKEIVLKILNK
jgi:hypothetical protein